MSSLLRPLHIAVIDPACRVAELDNFNRMVFANPEVRFSYHMPALFGMSSLEKLVQKPDALVIFGSGASVYDDLPWQALLHPWIKARCDEGLPTLGICYGHQLIAHLYGSRVGFSKPTQEKYKGLRAMSFKTPGFWHGGTGHFIVSHREEVTDLAPVFELCGSSPEVACELIRHRHLPVWGIQAHPEAGPEFLQNSEIELSPTESQPFASGQDFMRRFVLHLLQQRIQ